jgi:SAM-dependent methyltransferase
MKKFSELVNDQFWNITFKTGLYDFLVMSSYDMSLRTIVNSADIIPKSNILDVGCGSGRALLHLGNKLLETDSKWTGLEVTPGGVSACQHRINNLNLDHNAVVLPADMTSSLPVEKNSIDIAFAHFSTYVISAREKRVLALHNVSETLKDTGCFYIAGPAPNYNAKDQVKSSISIDQNNPNISSFKRLSNKLLFSTLGHYSENVISKKIQDGVWCSFTKEDMENEANDAGLRLKWSKSVYGDTSLLVALCK